MAEPFIGQIQIFAFNFAPRGWAFCNGQTLSINQNQALFSLLGTMYGGDGRTNFRLPELRGRFPLHFGQGPGLPNEPLGGVGGRTSATLTQGNMPPHTHNFQLVANGGESETDDPSGGYHGPTEGDAYASTGSERMGSQTTYSAGGGQQFDIRNPYLALNFCIALTGLFPSRN